MKKKHIPPAVPWEPVELEDYEIRAIKALFAGNASDAQQKTGMDVIVNKFAATYDQSFRPGIDGARATDFAEGKRYVGLQLVTMTKVNIGELERRERAAKTTPAR